VAKDKQDVNTVDMLGGKPGRPLVYPEWGPMSPRERQERSRRGRKVVQILMDEKELLKLNAYCKRHKIKRDQLVTNVIRSLRLTKPTFL